MRKWLLFVLACSAGFSSIAQTASPLLPSEDASAVAREQWRIELRTVLSTYRNAEQSESAAPPTAPAPGLRQLSLQEHAEMREQLRQYQPQKQRQRP